MGRHSMDHQPEPDSAAQRTSPNTSPGEGSLPEDSFSGALSPEASWSAVLPTDGPYSGVTLVAEGSPSAPGAPDSPSYPVEPGFPETPGVTPAEPNPIPQDSAETPAHYGTWFAADEQAS